MGNLVPKVDSHGEPDSLEHDRSVAAPDEVVKLVSRRERSHGTFDDTQFEGDSGGPESYPEPLFHIHHFYSEDDNAARIGLQYDVPNELTVACDVAPGALVSIPVLLSNFEACGKASMPLEIRTDNPVCRHACRSVPLASLPVILGLPQHHRRDQKISDPVHCALCRAHAGSPSATRDISLIPIISFTFLTLLVSSKDCPFSLQRVAEPPLAPPSTPTTCEVPPDAITSPINPNVVDDEVSPNDVVPQVLVEQTPASAGYLALHGWSAPFSLTHMISCKHIASFRITSHFDARDEDAAPVPRRPAAPASADKVDKVSLRSSCGSRSDLSVSNDEQVQCYLPASALSSDLLNSVPMTPGFVQRLSVPPLFSKFLVLRTVTPPRKVIESSFLEDKQIPVSSAFRDDLLHLAASRVACELWVPIGDESEHVVNALVTNLTRLGVPMRGSGSC